MTAQYQSFQGLKQLHELISGMLISSANAGNLVSILKLIIDPVRLVEKDMIRLTSEQMSLVLCLYEDSLKVITDTCSYADRHLINKVCSANYISGLVGFPLPKWPFFLAEGPLDPINHFISYVSAYHSNYSANKLGPCSICVCNDSSFLLVGYNTSTKSFSSSSSFSNGDSFLSFYSKDFGTLIIKMFPLSNARGNPIKFSKQLPLLQYDGNLQCFELNEMRGDMYCCANFYVEKSNKAQLEANLLLESVTNKINIFENLDDALRLQLLIQEEFLK